LRLAATPEVTTLLDRRFGEGRGEVAGIGTDPQPVGSSRLGADLFGDPGQATAQHVRGTGPDVVVAGQQLGRGGDPGFGPGRQVRTAGSLSGVVVVRAPCLREP